MSVILADAPETSPLALSARPAPTWRDPGAIYAASVIPALLFAAVAPTITTRVPVRSAVMSTQFGGQLQGQPPGIGNRFIGVDHVASRLLAGINDSAIFDPIGSVPPIGERVQDT
jgi:hypothetical protein